MKYSLADTLRTLRPHLPPALVPAEALDDLSSMASFVPAALTGWFYLETRLASADRRVDLVLDVDPRRLDLLAGAGSPLLVAAGGDELWRRVGELHAELRDRSSALRGVAKTTWLEFDVQGSGGRPPAPGVFVGLHDLPPGASTAAWRSLADTALGTLLGGGLDAGTARGLQRCFENLPGGAQAPYLGVMLSRGEGAVRVCLVGIPPGELLPYLEAVGWSGSAAELAAWLPALAGEGAEAHPGPAMLHLDVGPAGVLPRLGLEYMLDRRTQLQGHFREAAFLDRLVELGLACPGKRASLAGWPGYSVEQFDHQLWRSLLVRRVNHVKIVQRVPGEAPEAKLYLNFFHRFHPVRRTGAGAVPAPSTRALAPA